MNTLSDSVRLIASRFGAGDPPKAETELLVRFVAVQFGKRPEDVRLLVDRHLVAAAFGVGRDDPAEGRLGA